MKVLLIEDDPTMSDLLNLLLQPNQASVTVATSDLEAIHKAHITQPDLIIVDHDGPVLDDWQICRSIRSITTAPVLILSTQENPQEVANALDAGADHFLTKPVTSGILLATIKTLLRRKSIALGHAFTWREQYSFK
ncbi:MAG TPA: response regulator transcription factor [Anaerolineaceae bacterium]|nr:response regulator transcription factor [Anaerolineaceae bacterium]